MPEQPQIAFQAFHDSGRPLGPARQVPAPCRLVARSSLGATVCERGCGFTLSEHAENQDYWEFACPFGLSCAALRLRQAQGAGEPVLLVGGRVFENYRQFERFRLQASSLQVSDEALLEAAGELEIPFPGTLREAMQEAARSYCDNPRPTTPPPTSRDERPEDLLDLVAEGVPAAQPELPAAPLEQLLAAPSAERAGQLLVEAARRFCQAGKASLFQIEPGAQQLVLTHCEGLPPEVRPGLTRPLDAGPLALALRENRRLVVNLDNGGRDRFQGPSAHGHYRSPVYACLPVSLDRRCLGVLSLTDRQGQPQFGEAELRQAELAARLAALVLERHALNSGLRRVREAVDETAASARARHRRLAGLAAGRMRAVLDFRKYLEMEVARAARFHQVFCLALLHIHIDGDRLGGERHERLRELALDGASRLTGPRTRQYDLSLLYEPLNAEAISGQVLALLMPSTSQGAAQVVLKRLQESIHQNFLDLIPQKLKNPGQGIYLEAGLAEFPRDGDTPDLLCRAAEESLRLDVEEIESVILDNGHDLPQMECAEVEEENTP